MASPVVCGIYMLFNAHQLVYVGKSTDCYGRIATHRTNGREFDYATVTACPEADLAWIETALIKAFEPRQNRVGKPSEPAARARQVIVRDVVREPAHPLSTVNLIGARAIAQDFGLSGPFGAAIKSGDLTFIRKSANGGERLILRATLYDWCEARQKERFGDAADQSPKATDARP